MARKKITDEDDGDKKTPKNKPKTKSGRLLSRVEFAEAMRVQVDVFDKTYRQRIPSELVVKQGNRPLWRLESFRELYDQAIADTERKLRAKLTAETDDAMLAGGDSPALERYRLARAKQEELKLADMHRESVSVEQMTKIIEIYSSRVLSAGERLLKRFGDEARQFLDDALTDAAKEIEQQFAQSDETA